MLYLKKDNDINNKIRYPVRIFNLYVLLLPISTGLSGIIGNISLINYIAVAFIYLFCLLCVLQGKLYIRKESKIVIMYLLYTVFSIFWANNIALSWYFYTFLMNTIIFLIITSVKFREKELLSINNSIHISAYIAILATVINIKTIFTYRLKIKIVSTIGINDFASGLCLIIAFLLNSIINTTNRRWEKFFLLISMIVIIVLTGSRGALIMLGTMLFAFLLINRKSIKKSFIFFVVASIVLLLLYNYFYQYLPEVISKRLSFEAVANDSGSGRFEIWGAALNKYVGSNLFRLLFGYGYNSFQNIVGFSISGLVEMSHNVFIQTLIEGGAVGLILLIGAFIKAFLFARKQNNIMMMLAIIGLAISSLTLDMQATRLFGMIFTFTFISDQKVKQKEVCLK